MRLACQRHLDDVKHGKKRGLEWSLPDALYAIEFFPKFLHLAEGEHAGQPFVLQPWQQFIVGSLFGWLGRDGFRRFRRGFIETGKGSGKSPMLAGIGLYGLTFDAEPGAEIYAAAVTRDQAKIMFSDATKMVAASPALADLIDANANNLAVLSTNSFFRPVSSEGRGLDGHRVHMALIDEIHEHLTDVVVDKMRKGTKGRRQALVLEITNSGYDRQSVCWHEHEYSAKVLTPNPDKPGENLVANDAWFAYVCQLDACDGCRADGKDQPQEGCPRCDDWRDEAVWPKANPNLGVSLTYKYLRELVAEAIGMPSKQNSVKRFNFCIWTQSYSRFFDIEKWLACSATVSDADLVGAPCFGGLDLGQRDDLAAWVRIWMLADGRVAVKARFWTPESALTMFPNRPYQQWREAGILDVTDGNTADEDEIERVIGEEALAAGVQELAYDQAFANQMALHLQGLGITVVPTPQGFGLNEALLKLGALVKDGDLCHGGNPILSWMASHMVVREGTKGEIRPNKEKAGEKIDGIVALAMALSRAIKQPVDDSAPMITVLGG